MSRLMTKKTPDRKTLKKSMKQLKKEKPKFFKAPEICPFCHSKIENRFDDICPYCNTKQKWI